MAKVFVGLSGGVDSAVSAALLRREGHDVTGVFIKIWQPEFIECTWREDRLDAMRVAATLGIPFREIDLSEEYKRDVIEDMIRGYERGITPNPDVLCNSSIKFGHFLSWALAEGADYVATGHYARIEKNDDTYTLMRGVDTGKDQSYFLYQLGQKELSRTFFPAGEHTKQEIRTLARQCDLPNAEKPDSQGLCFVGDITMHEFLFRFITLTEGKVVDRTGAVLGTHDGAPLYTVGQRHGFRTSSKEPLYVTEIDVAANRITVSPHASDAYRENVSIESAHFVGKMPTLPATLDGQARYRERTVRLSLAREGSTMRVTFEKPHLVAPGQSLVLYQGDQCVGGGIIT